MAPLLTSQGEMGKPGAVGVEALFLDEGHGGAMTVEAVAGRKGRQRWPMRLAKAIVVGVAALAAIPLVLTPLYGVVDPVSTPILYRQITGQAVEHSWVPIDRVSGRLAASVIMSEDGQFCRHWGVDAGALREEVDNFLAGRPSRGASTLTMQVARNLFLWTDASLVRKLIEIPLAVYIDLVLPKRRIMEIYLNIAEWGPDGEFGVAAGAKAAFGIGPEAMSWRQAALLTTMLPNPTTRLASEPSAHLERVADIIEGRARDAGSRVECL
jgi:monofunctional biosynthetic peptidoglycan transglycosylase